MRYDDRSNELSERLKIDLRGGSLAPSESIFTVASYQRDVNGEQWESQGIEMLNVFTMQMI